MVRALGIVDSLFLLLENAKQPMHVAGMCVFELPYDHDGRFFDELFGQIDTEALPNFPFNQILHRGVMWRDAQTFHIHHHYHYHRLETGQMSEALTIISRLHEKRLDRSHPLWELHILDNLAPERDGGPERFVLYLKIHHTLMDGVAAMRLFQRSLSYQPDEHLSRPLWLRDIRHKKSSFSTEKKSWIDRLKGQIQSVPPVVAELSQDFQKTQNLPSPSTEAVDFISSLKAPPSMLNQRIGTSRHLSVIALEKSRFVGVAKKLSVSTNDMILAVCAQALREYLLSQDALPSAPLIAFVPTSLRKNNTAIGNQISFVPTNLGTHSADPLHRLQLIHQSMQAAKARIGRMTQSQFINYTAAHYAWAGINLATRLHPKKQAFNLIISNIPGDDAPLYLNGARLQAAYPASVLLDGQALNISFANYQDRIDFGITACQSTLPNIQSLTTLIAGALDDYENLVS